MCKAQGYPKWLQDWLDGCFETKSHASRASLKLTK